MSITCQICQESFPKIIPWQHLKTHNITTAEYKDKFGSLYSAETLAKHATRVPHNKGKKVTDPAHLAKIHEAITKREERFRNGEIQRGKKWDEAHKALLSQRSIEFAAKNRDAIKQRAQKALVTKLTKYGKIPAPFAGRKHTTEAKEKIKKASSEANKQKTIKTRKRILELANQYNLTVESPIGHQPLQLKCNQCHTLFEFTSQYFTPSKTFSEMCPTCFPRTVKQSRGETELFRFVQSVCPDAIQGYRKTYHSQELDIFIPSKNIGIEYDGLYWHSENVLEYNSKDKHRSFNKKKHFTEQGIRLITIFSDEWETQQDITQSRLSAILGLTKNKIYARKCKLQEISTSEASAFCNENHSMRHGRSNVRLGLYYQDNLVSVMTFSRSNVSRKVVGWELNRFASKLNTIVIGAASKLFNYFVKTYSPESIISYSDNRWSSGDLYSAIGFSKVSDGVPNYWYFKPPATQRIHRFTLRKTTNDNPTLTEVENRKAQGYLRIWDCGSSKWVWTQK